MKCVRIEKVYLVLERSSLRELKGFHGSRGDDYSKVSTVKLLNQCLIALSLPLKRAEIGLK